uniref:Uncharacterized protein n=1 Tax=Cladonia uncialis subsp. uncialis TaxID=180999 RepID=A0A2K9YDY4_CLAUC|nr:hypothetical protein [Cladonia uncialis subsp. uncialis]
MPSDNERPAGPFPVINQDGKWVRLEPQPLHEALGSDSKTQLILADPPQTRMRGFADKIKLFYTPKELSQLLASAKSSDKIDLSLPAQKDRREALLEYMAQQAQTATPPMMSGALPAQPTTL